jgi:1,2-diacylglycerol 3-alpha-glucosyltransferase
MENNKTILIATDSFMPRIDGISKILEIIIPEFESKYNVMVIAPEFKGDFEKKGNYEIYKVPIKKITIGDYPLPKRPNYKKVNDMIDKADIIFTHTMGPICFSVINSAYKKNKTILSFVHSIEWILIEKSLTTFNLFRGALSLITKKYVKRMYNKCTGIIVPSPDVGEILSLLGVKKPKFIVRLGIDSEHFIQKSKAESKKALKIDEDEFVVGYVGRIAREKSLLTLLKGFKKLEARKKRLLIVGEGIESLKNKLKGNNIIITGKVTDVVPYLNAMDVFVMPSLTETTCLAALEAMACEIPIITTKVGSIPHYVKNNKNGLFFPKKNDLVLSIRLNYLYEHDLVARSLGKAGRRTILQNYSSKSTINQILKIMEHYSK